MCSGTTIWRAVLVQSCQHHVSRTPDHTDPCPDHLQEKNGQITQKPLLVLWLAMIDYPKHLLSNFTANCVKAKSVNRLDYLWSKPKQRLSGHGLWSKLHHNQPAFCDNHKEFVWDLCKKKYKKKLSAMARNQKYLFVWTPPQERNKSEQPPCLSPPPFSFAFAVNKIIEIQ